MRFRDYFILVEYPIFINLSETIQIQGNVLDDFIYLRGVTKLRNEIFILCLIAFKVPHVIGVIEDRRPFRFQRNIEIKTIKEPSDIGSCEKENCLYVSDFKEKCVWKITRTTDYEHTIIKWLATDYQPRTLSVSSGGQLLMVNDSLSTLMIYGSDAELIRSIQLPEDMKNPRHAVETSIGNFIILHFCIENEGKGENWSMKRLPKKKLVVSELTRNGEIRRFTSSIKPQELSYSGYLSLNSDDQVFVADTSNHSVTLLNSDLRSNRNFCLAWERTKSLRPRNLCYDEGKKQLIILGELRNRAYIYNLSTK